MYTYRHAWSISTVDEETMHGFYLTYKLYVLEAKTSLVASARKHTKLLSPLEK